MKKETLGVDRMILKFLGCIFAAGAIAALGTVAAPAQGRADRSLSPYFFVKGDPAIDHLPLKNTRVEISVSGIIADVRVVQTYTNEGTRPINATYVFPASTRAAVYGMRMRIRDEVITAKIKRREAAKQEFEKAKKEGKSASLLEQDRPNVFTMNLANMMPKDNVEIELRYTELLVPTDGVYEVVYPTVVGPRYSSGKELEEHGSAGGVPYLREGTRPPSTLQITARVAAGIPIQELSSSSHQIAPEWLDRTVARVSLAEQDAFQANRDFILRYRLAGAEIAPGLLLFRGEQENFFLYMAQPPRRVMEEDIPSREYVFVVDVSGSMEGFPLEVSKRLLTELIGELRPTDFFNVVLFAGDSTALSESPLPANPENIDRALHLIEQQRGSGGTELLSAIRQAMALRDESGVSRSIVLVTDGYISAEDGVFEHIRQNLGRSNVFAFGIGTSVNRHLIEGVAKAGMGEPFVVENDAEAPGLASKFREYIQSPLLTDIDVRAHGFEIYDVQPRFYPDLLAQRPIVLFGKWRGEASGTFELRGRTGRGDFVSMLDVAEYGPDEGNSALRYLWARSAIAELSDYGFGQPTEEEVGKITDLGLNYNLLTRYTSFIAVREKIVSPNGDASSVDQPLPLPVGVSDMAVGSEPELSLLLAALAAVAGILILRRRAILKMAERVEIC